MVDAGLQDEENGDNAAADAGKQLRVKIRETVS